MANEPRVLIDLAAPALLILRFSSQLVFVASELQHSGYYAPTCPPFPFKLPTQRNGAVQPSTTRTITLHTAVSMSHGELSKVTQRRGAKAWYKELGTTYGPRADWRNSMKRLSSKWLASASKATQKAHFKGPTEYQEVVSPPGARPSPCTHSC